MDIKEEIKRLSVKFSKDIISLRRKIHQNPELAFQEYETSGLIYSELKKLRLENVRRIAGTGVTALIRGNRKGKCAALRADIDALPIHEDTGLPFSSRNEGKMHACGHDAHTAMLYGAARILDEIKKNLDGTVKLIFQPAEEKNPGGASVLIKHGVLGNPKVDVVFGQHVIVNKPAGSLGFCPGAMMASQDELYITIKGKSGHGAKPHVTVDPVVAASQFILALQTIVSRSTNPYEPIVISIGIIEGKGATNIIPAEVRLEGTIRTLNSKLREKSLKSVDRILRGITSSAGAKYELDVSPGYPELSNDEKITDFASKAAIEFTGRKHVFKAERFMGAEDFAFYLKKIPGTFYRIGVGNTSDIHTPAMNLDEKALARGSAFMAYLAWKYLSAR